MVDFKNSQTKQNLMRAYVGESQARNRYDFAADIAKQQKNKILEDLFTFTANQEKAHAEAYFQKLKEFSGEEITIDAAYPVEVDNNILKLLRFAERDEKHECDDIYVSFAKTAKDEGFPAIATLFENVASIERTHAARFTKYANRLENGSLFKEGSKTSWMCTNCGYIYEGEEAPQKCPVCSVTQDYYIRLSEANFE